MAHAIDMRVRAVELLKEGFTQKSVSKILNVGTTALKRWKNQIEKDGEITVYYNTSNRVAPKLLVKELVDILIQIMMHY